MPGMDIPEYLGDRAENYMDYLIGLSRGVSLFPGEDGVDWRISRDLGNPERVVQFFTRGDERVMVQRVYNPKVSWEDAPDVLGERPAHMLEMTGMAIVARQLLADKPITMELVEFVTKRLEERRDTASRFLSRIAL